MSPKRYQVFISHNSKDQVKIPELIKKLQCAGIEVWFYIDGVALYRKKQENHIGYTSVTVIKKSDFQEDSNAN